MKTDRYKYNKEFKAICQRLGIDFKEIAIVIKTSRQNVHNHSRTTYILSKSVYRSYIENIIEYIPLKIASLTERMKELTKLAVDLDAIKSKLDQAE